MKECFQEFDKIRPLDESTPEDPHSLRRVLSTPQWRAFFALCSLNSTNQRGQTGQHRPAKTSYASRKPLSPSPSFNYECISLPPMVNAHHDATHAPPP